MKPASFYLLAIVLLFPSSAQGGAGKYKEGTPDQIKLHVVFDYSENDTGSWEPLFEKASRLLFDATEEQVKISTVIFYNDQCFRGKTDVLVSDGEERANATGLLDDLGRIGLSRIHKLDEAETRGHVGLAHELGHYVFGLRDEYKDKNGREPAQGCLAPNETGFDHASLMTAGTTELNGRTEFCIEDNHNTGNTEQDLGRFLFDRSNTFLENSSGWKWVEAFARERYNATLVPPQDVPQSKISGFGEKVDFVEEECAARLSVGISSRNRPEAAASALEKFVRLLEGNDAAGLVFTGQETVPLRQMSTDNKFRSLAEIPMSDAAVDWTRLLRASLLQLSGGDDPDSDATQRPNEVVLLISDGRGGPEKMPQDLLSAIESRGITVHTIGVGDGSRDGGLSQAAAETDGSHLSADSAADIDAAAMTALAKIKDRGIIEMQEGRVEARTTLGPIEIPVDAITANEAADFLLTWSGPGQDPEMKLLHPDGTEVRPEASDIILQNDHDRKVKRYRLLRPAAGRWRVVISNPSSATRDYAFQAHSLAADVTVTSRASRQIVVFPEPILLRAMVAVDQPVAGARVTARIERPDRSTVTINLLDDGNVETRDAQANDGIYSGIFSDYRENGSYDIEITANSTVGITTSPGEPGGTFTPQSVPPFVRKDRFSVKVTGAPN